VDKERVAEVVVHAAKRGERRSGGNGGDSELHWLFMVNTAVLVRASAREQGQEQRGS
jgi:hypothetical protein